MVEIILVKVMVCIVCVLFCKICLVFDFICGKNVVDVIVILKFILNKVVCVIEKIFNLVIVNVENNFGLEKVNLVVFEIFVNEGLIMKCFCLCVKGLVLLINKCIIYVIVVVLEK